MQMNSVARISVPAWRLASWLVSLLTALVLASNPAVAGREGLPVAHTGAFNEPDCTACHRNTLGGSATVSIDVGPYVPGATPQPVIVSVVDPGARRWGFQLTARRASDPSQQAGSFEVPSQFDQFVRVRCANGNITPPACPANQLQYVTHTDAGSARGPAAVMKFNVNWRAPDSNIGDVVLSVAALGADGDLGTNGDRTAKAQVISLYAPSNTPSLNTGGAVNAAAPSGTGRSIAPKTLISIFGQKLAAPGTFREVSAADLDAQDRIPTELNRISVEFTSPPNDLTPRLGRVLFVSDTQINLETPDFFPSSGDTVQIQAVINRNRGANEVRSNVLTTEIRRTAPALFTLDSSGTGAVAAVHASGTLVAPNGLYPGSTPARVGETILIFGNGFGETTPSFAEGELPSSAANLNDNVIVEIGGLAADTSYKGVAPGFAGLYQFNVKIPNLAPSQYSIIIKTPGNVWTQPGVTIAVAQ
jgi:uncharacterized protein (TIGR03437 family)